MSSDSCIITTLCVMESTAACICTVYVYVNYGVYVFYYEPVDYMSCRLHGDLIQPS